MTRLDTEDNQQASQRESATELTTVITITIPEDFLQDICDNTSKHTFSRTFCMMVRRIDGSTTPVLFISQRLIHFHTPNGMVFHSCVYWLIERIVQHVLYFNTFAYGYQKPQNFMQSFLMQYIQV